jgi:NifB/MoaA-like Fe-S oxidoreductase
LGLSRFNKESAMRAHTLGEANAVVDTVHDWQDIFLTTVGHRMVFAADEYYLMTGRPFPPASTYAGFDMHEDGIGMARTFAMEFTGEVDTPVGPQSGFFAWVDGAPAAGYRAPRNPAGDTGMRGCGDSSGDSGTGTLSNVLLRPRADAPIGIITGDFGAQVLAPLVADLGRDDVRIIPVRNDFFGGNTAVTGLMVGEDIARTLRDQPLTHRYLLPDVCLSEGRFLDGTTVDALPRSVEVVPTNGISLRRALEARTTSNQSGKPSGKQQSTETPR